MPTLTMSSTIDRLREAVAVDIPARSGDYPLVITPKADKRNLGWADSYKEEIARLLVQYGAILIRGFDIGSAEGFQRLFTDLAGEAMEYRNRTSPREQVHNNVYTSTSHPSDLTIHMHTENSYSETFNRIIAFFCLVAPGSGGETPIADERRLKASLGDTILQKFRDKKIRYVRNTISGVGLDWRTIYQTDSRAEVNRVLNELGVEYEWVSEDHLRLQWVLPAFQIHPFTGEEVWFNHMYFGHKSLYDPNVLEFFDEKDLPFATYYGDGSPIEDEVIRRIRDFYEEQRIVFRWQQDDLLLLDNLLFSHGRNPFRGPRTILTAMAQPIRSAS